MRILDDILLEKCEALKEILTITKKQPVCIANDDTDELLTCISERQHFIDVVNMLDREAATARADGSGIAAQMQKEIAALLRTIQQQDIENEKMANAKIEEYRHLVRNYNDSSRSLGAYARHLEGGGASSYDVKQ